MIFNRYFTEGVVDPIAVTAGILQTGLYLDFFYVYFTKYVSYHTPSFRSSLTRVCLLEYFKERSSSFLHKLRAYYVRM